MKIGLRILIFNDVCFTLQTQKNGDFSRAVNEVKYSLEIVVIGYPSLSHARKYSSYFTFG